ncbi:glycosyltransferase [Consotaella sp. CSK11QG-6]
MRGGEKVLEALCELFPQADIFTLVCDEETLSERLRQHRITTSFLQKLPGARRLYQKFLPAMPWALESFDLSGYDVVISSESGPAKGIVAPPDALHICYCHSPMRYLWDQQHVYQVSAGRLSRWAMACVAPAMRTWDVTTAARVDSFVANSRHVADRIQKYYRRDAEVIHPPVAVESFAPTSEVGDFYLCAGQLVPYKRIDLAVQAFTRMNKKLVVVGDGAEIDALRKVAGPSIVFMGRQSDDVLRQHLSRCRALIFPGEEDFGMVPVEALASGRPVIGYARGGLMETVASETFGVLFGEQSVEALMAAVARFEKRETDFDPTILRAWAQRFGRDEFKNRFAGKVRRELAARAERSSTLSGDAFAPIVSRLAEPRERSAWDSLEHEAVS